MSQKSMMLYTSTWREKETFRLVPFTEECRFLEGIYDPSTKALALISKDHKESYHMVMKIDDQGEPLKAKRQRTNGSPYVEERRQLDTYYEWHIEKKEEIEEMIKRLAINDTFDFQKFLD